MKKFYTMVVRRRKLIIVMFLLAVLVSVPMQSLVEVNYDMNDYLPEDTDSMAAVDVMEAEFDGGIPNARVMVKDVTTAEALVYKEQLAAVDGVTDVTWLDDSVDITVPLFALDTDTVETYYKDDTVLFSVTIEEEDYITAVAAIREIIGEDNAMTGSAVSTAESINSMNEELSQIIGLALLVTLAILLLTTTSWAEPVLILLGLGVAVLINNGTNLIFGEISFVTNAAGSIIQLAVSIDYSIFLLHRFEECRKETSDPEEAMADALCKSTGSILSSGLTTVIGFLALVLMRFQIGPDLGLALAKGVAISLITVFFFMPSITLCTYKIIDHTRHRSFLPDFRRFGGAVRRIAVPMACIFFALIVPSYLASNSNDYYYGNTFIFDSETQVGMETEEIEAVYGESDTWVLLVPKDDLAKQTALSEELHGLSEVTDIISYVDLAGAEIPTSYPDEETLSELMSDRYSRFVISVSIPYEGEEAFALVEEVRAIAESYYPDAYYLTGEAVGTYDLMDTIQSDMVKVNLVAIAAVFLVLLLTMRSLSFPVLLVLSIETAIWLNLSCPYFMDQPVFYIAYLIINSIQLGATVDYAILMANRYRENRLKLARKEAVRETVSGVTVSILTSGSALTIIGFLLGFLSSNQLLSQLGIMLGRGGLFSLLIVLFVLPGMLYLFDRVLIREREGRLITSRRRRPENTRALRKTE